MLYSSTEIFAVHFFLLLRKRSVEEGLSGISIRNEHEGSAQDCVSP